MSISYDEQKCLLNIENHSIDFIGSEVIFDNPMLTQTNTRVNYSEQ